MHTRRTPRTLVCCVAIVSVGAAACNSIWSRNVTWRGLTRAEWYETSEPVSDGERVYVGSVRGVLMSVEADTGKVAWRVDTPAAITAAPEVYENTVFAGGVDGYLRAYHRATGEEKWVYEFESPYFSQPHAWGETVYVQTGDRSLTALYTDTGELRWQYRHEAGKQMTLLGMAHPTYADGTVIAAFPDGRVGAFNAFTGEIEWMQKYTKSRRFEDIDGTPVLDSGVVYFGTADGDFIAAAADTGDVLWRFPAYGCLHPPVVDDMYVYLATQHKSILALDRRTGSRKWEVRAPKKGVPSAPVLIDEQLIFADHWGRVHFLYTGTGHRLDTVRLKTQVFGSITQANGHLYAMSGKGYLIKVR